MTARTLTFGVTVQKHVEVTLATLEGVIEQAGFGMAGWAGPCTWDDRGLTYTVTWEDWRPGMADAERHERTLTYQAIADALGRVYAGEGNVAPELAGYVRATLDDQDDPDDVIDSDAADAVIQVALFGSVIYG